MKLYKKILFTTPSTEASEILMALLEDKGFYAFESEETFLAAYTEAPVPDIAALENMLPPGTQYHIETIPEKNWNEEWEKSFAPVVIDDFAAIRAQFHPPVPDVVHEIIITPKMSFGTGHHATTHLMIQAMKRLNFQNKHVIDFGTGTGVLSILSEKLGAQSISAIDNDPWSVNNAIENIEMNHCSKIVVAENDNLNNENGADILLANINKNILTQHASSIVQHLESSGTLVISGFLTNDVEDLKHLFESLKMKTLREKERTGWAALTLTKQ